MGELFSDDDEGFGDMDEKMTNFAPLQNLHQSSTFLIEESKR